MIWNDSWVQTFHRIKGVGQQSFFPDENTLTSLPSSIVFLCSFSFIFRLRNPVMCSRSRFWVTWRRQSRILSVWHCTKFSGVSTTGDRYNTPRTNELSFSFSVVILKGCHMFKNSAYPFSLQVPCAFRHKWCIFYKSRHLQRFYYHNPSYPRAL